MTALLAKVVQVNLLRQENIVRQADRRIFVVLIDSENALDEKWLHALDVDTSEDKLLKLNMSMIDDVAKTVSDFMKDYKAEYADKDKDERPKALFVVDPLVCYYTETDVDFCPKGDMKGDMGRNPKALTALVRNTVNMFGEFNVGMLCTNSHMLLKICLILMIRFL